MHPAFFLKGLLCSTLLVVASAAWALPSGYEKQMIPLNAPPVGLAFDSDGVLYALESASGTNEATMRVIQTDYSLGDDFPVIGDDPNNFYVGGMTYDPVTDNLLITDNTADGRLYSVSKTGTMQILAIGIPAIADVAVRFSGEIFVTTALGDNQGEVLQIDREDGHATSVATGIDFGAGLAFDPSGDLMVQEADATTFTGRLHRLPILETETGLNFGNLTLLLDNMRSSAGLAIDSEGDLFSSGSGGLFSVSGTPLLELPFDDNGNSLQYATALAFDGGPNSFEPFAGPDAGRLALMADFGFTNADTFVTLIQPKLSDDADFNEDNQVDGDDLAIWTQYAGVMEGAYREQGDANGDRDIDGHDFLLWQCQFDMSEPSFSVRTIPEPMAIVLAGAAWVIRCGMFRRSRIGWSK